jgi:hypothetical protein
MLLAYGAQICYGFQGSRGRSRHEKFEEVLRQNADFDANRFIQELVGHIAANIKIAHARSPFNG